METMEQPRTLGRVAWLIIRVGLSVASLAVGLAMVGAALTFGDCAGWKGTGTCPRVPWWDGEVFRIASLGAAIPVALIRWAMAPSRRRAGRALLESLVTGAATGLLVVAITAA